MDKIYLDNCCYNRPYDDQSQLKIQLETQAKLKIQHDIKQGDYKLVWSYVMEYENSNNPFEEKKRAIAPWKDIADENIVESESILQYAEGLADKGIKTYDALHVACAVEAGCDYFLTTDDRILKYKSDKVTILNPIQFIQILSQEGL